jgi:hypothetical protein
MTWKASINEGVAVWRHADGLGTIAASPQGVFAIIGPRMGRFIKGERRLLDLLAQCTDEETEQALLHAWSAHLRGVVERDAPALESILDHETEPLRMPKRGDLK